MQRIAPILLLVLATTAAHAAEGKWTPQQVLQLDPQWLKKEGLQLPPSRLWDPQRGTGLLAGAINVGGCSAGFVSPDGLFATNHHCLFSILQEHATPQNDIIANGFIARTRADELKGTSIRVTVPRRFTDVTKEVLAAIPASATDAQRTKAIEKKSNELVAECEKRPMTRCRVASFDGGLQYVLVDSIELSDVRLVYAPPRSVGEYGGEVDNWMWPRHTGDFAIGRAYVDGKPYRNEFWFPISTAGLKPNDFVMVLGYPGITYRSLTAPEMEERRDLWFARRVQLYGEWIRILEETTRGNSEGTITVASDLKSLANVYKNAEGQLAGFKRGKIVEKQSAADRGVVAWAEKNPKYRDAVAAHEGLTQLVDEERKTFDHDFLLYNIGATQVSPRSLGPKALYLAASIVRSAVERQKPDAERDMLYMNRNLARFKEQMQREQKNYFAPADKRLLASFIAHAKANNIPAIERIGDIDALYAQTKVFDEAERMKMLDETPEQLRARHDPLIDLGFELDGELRDLVSRRDRWDGTVARLRPVWRRAVIAHAGHPVAPDANSTLRVSFAHVEGYSPRDGLFAEPQTTLSGVVEKNTGEEPFHAPRALLDAAAAKRYGRWKDAKLNDVPVDFLADADTTGGNSGSPVVNAKGELVGLNFDRVWENVANDFGYNHDVARNVNVDIRYLLWMLDEVQGAEGVLHELGVR
jgi:hypothetical protein